jgi:quercetin dioxygenase-like cupin family protein
MTLFPDIARRASVISGRLILLDRETPQLVVHEWERDGQQENAWPGDGKIPPYDAARIGLKLFSFPTGQLRVIEFESGCRTPWHLNKHQDALFYGVTATQVEFVNQAVHLAHPGDASIHPEGTMHHSETITGGIRAEFAFVPQGKSGRDLVAIPGRDLTLHHITEWVQADRKRTVFGPSDHEGGKFRAKLFQLPAYAILEAHYPAGLCLPPHRNDDEKIAYVISGRYLVTSGNEKAELGPGDAFRMAADTVFARHVLEAGVVIEVDGSRAPPEYAFPANSPEA